MTNELIHKNTGVKSKTITPRGEEVQAWLSFGGGGGGEKKKKKKEKKEEEEGGGGGEEGLGGVV